MHKKTYYYTMRITSLVCLLTWLEIIVFWWIGEPWSALHFEGIEKGIAIAPLIIWSILWVISNEIKENLKK